MWFEYPVFFQYNIQFNVKIWWLVVFCCCCCCIYRVYYCHFFYRADAVAVAVVGVVGFVNVWRWWCCCCCWCKCWACWWCNAATNSGFFNRFKSVIFSNMLVGTPFNLAASTSFFNSSTSRFNFARLFWNLFLPYK